MHYVVKPKLGALVVSIGFTMGMAVAMAYSLVAPETTNSLRIGFLICMTFFAAWALRLIFAYSIRIYVSDESVLIKRLTRQWSCKIRDIHLKRTISNGLMNIYTLSSSKFEFRVDGNFSNSERFIDDLRRTQVESPLL